MANSNARGFFICTMINNLNTVYALFAITMCLVMAYFAAFTELFAQKLAGNMRYVFVGLMLVYAAYRSYRIIHSVKKSKRENQEL